MKRSDLFYPPSFQIYIYIAIVAVSMAVMVPILIKGHGDNMAIREMNHSIEQELAFYSSIIHTMNEDRNQRAWTRQYGDIPYLDWGAVRCQEVEITAGKRHRIDELLSIRSSQFDGLYTIILQDIRLHFRNFRSYIHKVHMHWDNAIHRKPIETEPGEKYERNIER